MKVKYLQIRDDMRLGDFISIPFKDGFMLGVVDGLNHEFFNLKIIRNDIYYSEEEIGTRISSEGKLVIGVVG